MNSNKNKAHKQSLADLKKTFDTLSLTQKDLFFRKLKESLNDLPKENPPWQPLDTTQQHN